MIKIEIFTKKYIPELVKWFENKENRQHMQTKTITLAEAKQLIKSNKHKRCYLIKKEMIPIGYCMLKDIDTYPKIGIMLDQKYWGHGYGKKVIEKLHKEAHKLGCKKLGLMVRKENKRAINMYKKIGYKITNHIMERNI